MERVGFVGLGNMGAVIAQRIRSAGFELTVYDIRPEAARASVECGARLATSPADVARSSDIILSSLPAPPDVEAVALGADGLIAGIRPGSVYVDLTTSSPALIRRIHARFDEKGAHVLDAPLSGGREELLHGKQEVTVGSDYEVFQRVRPVLAAFCDQIIYAGAIGAGTVCKLVHNMLMRDLTQAIAEGMTLGVKAGVEAEVLWEAIRRGLFGKQMLLHVALPQTAFRGNYESPSYTLALAHKDMTLAMELAREFSVPLPISSIVAQVNIHAMGRCWGAKDHSASFVLQEEAAGVEVRAPNIDAEKAARYISIHPDYAERGR